ncbi:MAG TPA: hypothetical protein VMU25_00880 [Candidatus Paceibacterota bacterium]|nr:hypothetical protein [Candidatus Paceibacterota bacterium]
MKIYINDEKHNLLSSQLQAADDFLARAPIEEIVFEGRHFTPTMIEIARMALRHRIVMRGTSPETFNGMDQLVTGGLQNIH